jgi:hypothetical protein
MDLTPTQAQRIVSNVRRVFDKADITLLNKQAYNFIIMNMGHIAHYDLNGFQHSYSDLRMLARSLQASEYSSDDMGYNFRWADELDRRRNSTNIYDQKSGQPATVTDTIRKLTEIARDACPKIDLFFGQRQREAELEQARILASRNGFQLVEVGAQQELPR